MEFLAVYFEIYLNYAIIVVLFIFISFVNKRIRSVYKNLLHNTENGLTGRHTAEMILYKNDIHDIYIIQTKGTLTDRYSFARKQIYLSEKTITRVPSPQWPLPHIKQPVQCRQTKTNS